MAQQHHRYIRYAAIGLFLAVTLLVPLRAVFACVMMDHVVEQCCCERACKPDCQSQQTKAGDCCDSIYLPQAKLDGLSTPNKALTATQPDESDLPPILPPRDVGPDPPASSDTNRLAYLSVPPTWLEGSQLYLLTLRLRN